jgi:ATP-binding cassette subfamily C (CFTR/MRP) protein 10
MLQQDILTIDEWVPFEMNRLLAYTFGLFGSVFVIIFSSYLSVLLFIPVAFYYVNLFKDYNPASRLLSKKMKKVNEPFLNLYYDTIEGKTVIRACRKEPQFINKLHFYIEKFIRILHTEQCLGFWLSLRLDLLAFYIYSFIMILIGFCIHQGQYDVITILSLALTYAMNITSPLSNFLPWITYTEEQFYSVERVLDKINEIGDEKNIKINEKSISYNPFEYNENKILEFKNVNLKYDQTSDILALNDISFEVFKAQKIAIIGRTGAGKSSIFSSIFRIYDIDDGLIRFNNVDIKDIELENLRKEISVVPKDVLILEGTVKSNIDFLSLYSDEYFSEFMSIFADIFGTKPEFELFTKNLFTYKIENGGTNLSEGQKCLIQIFRCIIRKSKLICLDESNGELDDDTEEKLFNILFEKFNHTTFIVIAHKLNILNKFDNILVIEGGKIAECGTPRMILNKN